jgi:hypothetical protein
VHRKPFHSSNIQSNVRAGASSRCARARGEGRGARGEGRGPRAEKAWILPFPPIAAYGFVDEISFFHAHAQAINFRFIAYYVSH